MQANEFPIDCDLPARSLLPLSNRIDEALRNAFWNRRGNTPHNLIIGKRTTTHIPMPTRRSSARRHHTTPSTTATAFTVASSKQPVILAWNKLLVSTTTLRINTVPPRPSSKKPRKKLKTTTTSAKIKKPTTDLLTERKLSVKRISKKSTTTTTEVSIVSSTAATASKPRFTAEHILGPLLRKELPWRPVHWLSGARPIPDSVLAAHFLNWWPKAKKEAADRSVEKHKKKKKTADSESREISRSRLVEQLRRVGEESGVESLQLVKESKEKIANSTELTGIRGVMERLKNSQSLEKVRKMVFVTET